MDLMFDSSWDNFDEEKIERDAEVANKGAGALVNWKNRGEQTEVGEYWKCLPHFLVFGYLYLFETEIWNTT